MGGSMVYKLRRPNFRVVFLRPNYSDPGAYLETQVAVYESRDTNKSMLAYSYRQDVASFESPFSVVFTPEEVTKNGDTIADVIKVTDIVKIEEYGKIKYMGVVNSIRYTMNMTDSGPDRLIVIGGYGVGGILGRFSILLDKIILADAVTTLESMEKKVRVAVSEVSGEYGENASMAQVLKKIASSFKEAQEKVGGYPSGTGIYKVIDQYMKYSADAEKLNTKYPMALSVFNYGGNTLLQAWQSVVFPPLYEFFMRWDEPTAAYLIMLRPTPFDPEAWLALKNTTLNPVDIQSSDIGFSDDDVKTWFFAYLTGGSMSYEIAKYTTEATITDKSKWALYGYRPLEANFKYANYDELKTKEGNVTIGGTTVKGDSFKDINPGEQVSAEKLMNSFGKKMYQWFRRADEMAQGSITMNTVEEMPTIGERTNFKGSEFYVEAIDGSWQDGGPMTSKLTLTRGGKYNQKFNTSSEETSDNWWFKKIRVSEFK